MTKSPSDPEELGAQLNQAAQLLPVGEPRMLPPAGAISHVRRTASVVAAALVAAAAAIFGAVLGLHGSNSRTPSAGVSAAPPLPLSQPPSQPASPSPSQPAPSSSGNQPTNDCTSQDLSFRVVTGSNFAFHHLDVLGLSNKSSGPCSMRGYPAVIGVSRSGGAISIAPHKTTASGAWPDEPVATVVLQPGEEAGIYLASVSDPNGSCVATVGAEIRVTPPAGGPPGPPIPVQLGLCPGMKVDVSPILSTTALPQPNS
jgi:hypothetical protein